MAKNQPAKQPVQTVQADPVSSEELVSGELAGDSASQVASDTPAIDPEALATAGAATVTPIAPIEVVSAFVLCAGSFDGVTSYPAGRVIEGVPVGLAEANTHWLDVAPSAVDAAKENGAQVVEYQD